MRRFIILIVSASLGVLGLLAGASPALDQTGTVITTASTPFGTALVVGSGPYKGYSLYDITSDNAPTSYGCTTTVLHLGGQALSCTGPSNDKNAVWPAITTTGAPVAGPGVHAGLLGPRTGRASAARSPTPGTRPTCSTTRRTRSTGKASMIPRRRCRTGSGSWSGPTATSCRGFRA